jgi:hypothetical protein
LFTPGAVSAMQTLSTEKATGIAVLPFVLLNAAFSPKFWIVTFVVFALLMWASGVQNKIVRVLFFWIPTVGISTITAAVDLSV